MKYLIAYKTLNDNIQSVIIFAESQKQAIEKLEATSRVSDVLAITKLEQ